jgi:CHASE2 domain-containing sensor protein
LINFLSEALKRYLNPEFLFKPLAFILGIYARKHRFPFYISLALGFIIFMVISLALIITDENVKSSTYDYVIRNRLSSPKPSDQILIVDIDEKSIAELSPKYGRWPWPRELTAELIANLEDAQVSTIYLNMILAEKDLNNKNSDNVFQSVLNEYDNIVIPWVRLNPKNDSASEFLTSKVPSFVKDQDQSKTNHLNTIALIPSLFYDKNKHHGFSNLNEDDDGIIREYKIRFEAGDGLISSSALVASQIFTNKELKDIPNKIHINWRNKEGTYKRISFSSLLHQFQDGTKIIDAKELSGKIVIIGSSAPGIANLKATSSKSLMDDNEIIATTIDDLVNKSYLHLMPIWIDKSISAILIILFCCGFIYGVTLFDMRLWASESLMLMITLGFVSYTKYFINLSESIAFSLSYLGLSKIYETIDIKASRAEPFFSSSKLDDHIDYYNLILFDETKIKDTKLNKIKYSLEKIFGNKNVYILDNIFDGSHLLQDSLSPLKVIIIFSQAPIRLSRSRLNTASTKEYIDIPIKNVKFFSRKIPKEVLRLDDKKLKSLISVDILELSQRIVKESST